MPGVVGAAATSGIPLAFFPNSLDHRFERGPRGPLADLYGVVSYTVARRRREIAIRMAVGAQVSDVRRLVLLEAGGLLGIGSALGIGAALALTRQLQAILFETSPLDPAVFGGVSALLVSICLLASWLPARRAAQFERSRT